MSATGLRSIDRICETVDCVYQDWVTVPKEEMSWDKRWACPMCEAEASVKRVMSAPNLMQRALPDGTKRFANLKEANRLTQDMYELPYDKRAGVQREIDKLEGRPIAKEKK